MSTSIVTITPKGSNASQVHVDSGYANSLNRFMSAKGIVVHPPADAMSQTLRVYVDTDGKQCIEMEPLNMMFMASATPKQLESIIADWLPTVRE
jgi:hypothetical protein